MMDVLFKVSGGGLGMATVKCDVCGGTFSQSYLASHKRLAHGKNNSPAASLASEDETVHVIVSLYGGLSAEGRRRVLRLLTAKNKKGREIQQG
jgi:hypothetical protein